MVWARMANFGLGADLNDGAPVECAEQSTPALEACRQVDKCARIALLTPYRGNNLGDASIQDAAIANIRLRLPDARFSGISLNCDNFVDRHGEDAFPLLADRQFHGTFRARLAPNEIKSFGMTKAVDSGGKRVARIKTALTRAPVLGRCLKAIYKVPKTLVKLPREIRHTVEGFLFIRRHDLLVVSGGGQLNEEYGGAWLHPFGLFKWAMLARLAGVPCVVASVGAVKVESRTSRVFIASALRTASYRSYRDKHSRDIVTRLVSQATGDPVVPDLAFSLPASALPRPAEIRAIAQGRRVVAISPISYGKPQWWCFEDSAVHNRYVQEMARLMSELLKSGYFLVVVWSCLEDDESVIPDLLERLDPDAKQRLHKQLIIPTINTWMDLVATLRDVDLLVASRLHSIILGFVSEIPTVAISFDPKVEWVMEDLGQTDFVLQISDFTSADVIHTIDRLQARSAAISEQIAIYRRQTVSQSAPQYDLMAKLAEAHRRTR
jgi:polysaccharide pyruvyl transferase WcaK-like protein